MTHQSLYRKHRPSTFADVVGQSHITRTLRNAVSEGTVAHAYLFTGPRGTGKTTVARILAKALECDSGPTPDPDATCEQCRQIAEGTHPDVFEIDAASRTGVDNVREEIIGRLAYAATRGRWKIYIIDEVHMLSAGAFNALLKSIEEPPAKVLFILCTTHPHKVPETIHSRCQRFDFHRIGAQDIAARLRQICDAESIKAPDAALALIAKHAAGGMRDAITTLEQLAAFSGDDISLDDVGGLLGATDTGVLIEAANLIADRDVPGGFRFLASLAETGIDLAEFVRDLMAHTRDLYVVSLVGDATGIVDVATDDLARMTSQASRFGGPDRLARVLDVLGALSSEMRWSSDARLALEVAFVRLMRPESDLTLESLAERIEALELGHAQRPPAAGALASTPAESAMPAEQPVVAVRGGDAPAEPDVAPAQPVVLEPRPTGGIDRASAKRGWPAVIAEVKKVKPARAQMLATTEVDVDADGETLVIEFAVDAKYSMTLAEEPEMRTLIKRALAAVYGTAPSFRYQLGRGAVRPDDRPAPHVHTDVLPATGGDETEMTAAPGPPARGADEKDIDRILIEGLGAEVLDDHPDDE